MNQKNGATGCATLRLRKGKTMAGKRKNPTAVLHARVSERALANGSAKSSSADLPLLDQGKLLGLVGIPVVDVGCKFLRPTTYDDTLEVHTRVEEWREKSFVMKHEIRRNGELLAEASEVRVFAIRHPEDPKRIKAVPPPEDIRRQCE